MWKGVINLREELYSYDGYDSDNGLLITYYYLKGYEGEGEAIYVFNNQISILNLAHCSCYGPLEEDLTKIPKYTIEEFENLPITEFNNVDILRCWNWLKNPPQCSYVVDRTTNTYFEIYPYYENMLVKPIIHNREWIKDNHVTTLQPSIDQLEPIDNLDLIKLELL